MRIRPWICGEKSPCTIMPCGRPMHRENLIESGRRSLLGWRPYNRPSRSWAQSMHSCTPGTALWRLSGMGSSHSTHSVLLGCCFCRSILSRAALTNASVSNRFESCAISASSSLLGSYVKCSFGLVAIVSSKSVANSELLYWVCTHLSTPGLPINK